MQEFFTWQMFQEHSTQDITIIIQFILTHNNFYQPLFSSGQNNSDGNKNGSHLCKHIHGCPGMSSSSVPGTLTRIPGFKSHYARFVKEVIPVSRVKQSIVSEIGLTKWVSWEYDDWRDWIGNILSWELCKNKTLFAVFERKEVQMGRRNLMP